jgi:Rod binding domain-containing protein
MDVRSSLGVTPDLGPMDFLRGSMRDLVPGANGGPPAVANGSSSTPTGPAAGGPAAPTNLVRPMAQRDIDHVAEGFDAMFASLLIKQMRQTLDQEGDGGMFGKDSGDVLGGLFDTFMGDHLAKAGGLGIGKMVKHQLEQISARRNPYAAQAAIAQTDRAANGATAAASLPGPAFPTAANTTPR